ncbi:J domain-containing protein [Hymenobacter actinosclerus]|uniref:DnaJ domain-containing protein n=1 Tax=Hymenobacter actinosclerus TaxID=82805 RepID=A0A1H9ZLS1_9BACT|nr:J domain-containing protein [Hymenobacter actinosclerus]SES81748.1 DnaJ domain-containing protein [Hymenobacter actinosclerus]
MSTHYATLGLPASASAADIRRAYRQLVWITHPDRTPDPAAHARYLAVNDAYEVLSNPARRAAYDAALEWRATAAQRPAPRPAPATPPRPTAPHHRPPAGFRRPPKSPLHVLYAAQFARALPKFRVVAWLSLLVALAVLIDCGRSQLLANESIRQIDYPGKREFVATTDNARIRSQADVELAVGDLLDVYQTPWLGKVREVHVKSGATQGSQFTVNNFRMVWLLSLVVLATAGAVLSGQFRPDQAFSAGFVNCVGLFFLGICLLVI